MEEDVRTGNWNDCVQASRAVAELMKAPEELKAVMVADGLTDAASEDLLKAIRGAFDFASKFIKKVDREAGGINPALVARKEDAMFVYSNALTLVNLLATKRNRANR
ncbi:MAG: hypothetical protein L3K16_01450 [Thermoplasmata archaeon]|nr:hypothetical protein [Thermoplasmata archaeon]